MKKLSWLILLLALIASVAYGEFREQGGKSIYFTDEVTPPASTVNRLYRVGGSLYFHNTLISTGS